MMFSGKLFTIISAVLAVAVNGSPVELAERAPQTGSVTYCADPNFAGCSQPVSVEAGACKEINDLDNQVSSFSYSGLTSCTLYADHGCGGTSLPLKSSVTNDLSAGGLNFDNVASSYKCLLAENSGRSLIP